MQSHALRYTTATYALRCGAGLYNVSRTLGRADTSTTLRVYIMIDPKDSTPAINALRGIEDW